MHLYSTNSGRLTWTRLAELSFSSSAAAALVGTSPVNAAANASRSRDSRLMGQAKFVDVNGIRTRYFDGGTGEPMVLVHGGQWPSTASADTWAPIFDHLAAKFHVYAVDKLGMGFTDNPKTEADFSMDAINDHTLGFIQAVGIRRAVLVGHSRGALPVARIAVDHPDTVSHLVILDSNTLAPPDPNTPERIDPEANREPPSREELKRIRLRQQPDRREGLSHRHLSRGRIPHRAPAQDQGCPRAVQRGARQMGA